MKAIERTRNSWMRVVVCMSLTAISTSVPAWPHCQVPCGIYDDMARVTALGEDATTIAKAVTEIAGLAGKSEVQSLNQITRWVMTKEQHASHIIDVVSNYFLAQRVKPGEDRAAYLESLADHHAVITAAMKAKQRADTASVDALNAALEKMATHYHSH